MYLCKVRRCLVTFHSYLFYWMVLLLESSPSLSLGAELRVRPIRGFCQDREDILAFLAGFSPVKGQQNSVFHAVYTKAASRWFSLTLSSLFTVFAAAVVHEAAGEDMPLIGRHRNRDPQSLTETVPRRESMLCASFPNDILHRPTTDGISRRPAGERMRSRVRTLRRNQLHDVGRDTDMD
jgi:hypothetical protein